MRSACLAALVSALLLTALTGPRRAHAESADASAADHYQQAITHYNLGEFDQAIVEFKLAYELSHEPALLFNIAQVYRDQKDWAQALHFYEVYLAELPDAPNRAEAEQAIAEMKAHIAKAEREARAKEGRKDVVPPNGGGGGQDDVKPQPLREVNRGQGKKIASLVTAGAGALLVGTGVYFGRMAQADAEEISQASRDRLPWTTQLEEVQSEGQRASAIAITLYAVGGAALAGGGVLYWLGVRDTTHVAVAPVAGGGAQMVMTCDF